MSPAAFEVFLARLKLDANPFAKTNAAQEDRLERYFITPKYFSTVQGDPTQPASALVFAPRGTGKTAQKIMLERACPDVGVLPISYDYFPMPAAPNPDAFGLDYHLRNVLRQGILSLIAYMVDAGLGSNALTDQSRKNLAMLAAQYIGVLNVEEVDSFQESLLGRIEKLAEVWNNWRVVGTAVLKPLLNKVGIDDLPALPAPKTPSSQPPEHHWALFKAICKDLKFRSVYVLVDRVDETQWTGNNAERAYFLIASLLRSLPTLDDPYVGWKFFIWDRVAQYCREDARPDRVQQFTLEWSDGELSSMLDRRIQAYSAGVVTGFAGLLASDISHGGYWCVLFSNESPRNLIRMCNDVLSEQAELGIDAAQISGEAIERGITKFCSYSVLEAYPEVQVRDMRRIARPSFTIAYLATKVYKEEPNSTRNRIRGWEASGIVNQKGTIKLEAGIKPSNYYMVLDPRVVRLQFQGLSIQEVLDSKSLPCEACGRVIFSDFESRQDDFICPHCDTPAFG